MEGKAMIFKEFANIDAFPIALKTKDPGEIIATVRNISATFGGINLEDISAPRCFEIEKQLRAVCDIPVIHDASTALLGGPCRAHQCWRLKKRHPKVQDQIAEQRRRRKTP
jgi:malate dehydrogenase (oxaloacetate-decarboxylating)